MTTEVFVDDDTGYVRWLGANPTGYVLNTTRNPTGSYLILHRASCATISGSPVRSRRWTGDYIKVCSAGKTEIEGWADETTGGRVQMCRLCSPQGRSLSQLSRW